MLLYLTLDKIGLESGGGVVTQQELVALNDLSIDRFGGECTHIDYYKMKSVGVDLYTLSPFDQDRVVLGYVQRNNLRPRLTHCYAGSLSKTVKYLKSIGSKVTYTVAAHNKEVSIREHQVLGLDFNYPHLTVPDLWQEYIRGYLLSDVIVCPSYVAARYVHSYGFCSTAVIHHGVFLPEKNVKTTTTDKLTVGYLGAVGPDKGLIYLLKAWAKLDPNRVGNSCELLLAGGQSQSDFVKQLIQISGAKNVHCLGWVKDPNDFYRGLHLYVQPSATEGFGIEVLEAMANGIPVVCSQGAGASDCIRHHTDGIHVPACDSDKLAQAITDIVTTRGELDRMGANARERAKEFTWDVIKKQYIQLWKDVLAC